MVTVAPLIADRARDAALGANRRRDFLEAQRILRQVMEDLRAMTPGNPRILAIIDQLHHDELEFGDMMDPMAMKARHFASYSASHSRNAEGSARKKKRPD